MATPPRLQIKRTLTADNPPAALEEGELSVELGGPIRLWAGHPTDPAGKVLLVDSSAGGGGTVDAYTKAEADAKFVDNAGDTMTGNLTIGHPTGDSRLILNKIAGVAAEIRGHLAGAPRWTFALGDSAADSNFNITRFLDNGSSIPAMIIGRTAGNINFGSSNVVLDGTLTGGNAALVLNKSAGGSSDIKSNVGPDGQWLMQLGDATGDFVLHRYPTNVAAYAYWIQKTDGGLYYQSDLTHKPAGGEWVAASDARIKTIVDYYDTGLDAIKQLNPVRYTYNGNDAVKRSDDTLSPSLAAGVMGKEFIGLVAQDVEGPMPELVTSVEGYIDGAPVGDLRMMDASALKFALVNAVKELALRVESLEEQLAATRK